MGVHANSIPAASTITILPMTFIFEKPAR
jgi:hypothetical protein